MNSSRPTSDILPNSVPFPSQSVFYVEEKAIRLLPTSLHLDVSSNSFSASSMLDCAVVGSVSSFVVLRLRVMHILIIFVSSDLDSHPSASTSKTRKATKRDKVFVAEKTCEIIQPTFQPFTQRLSTALCDTAAHILHVDVAVAVSIKGGK